MDLVLCFIFGVFIGGLVANFIIRKSAAKAVFKIDHSDPETDRYRFDIDDFKDLDSSTYLLLKIDHNANLSQK